MEVQVGKVLHYYNHLGVAVITLVDSLKLGDRIHISGYSTNFEQRVSSMEINHHSMVWVKPGDSVALRVIEPVHVHDVVFRVVEEMAEPAY